MFFDDQFKFDGTSSVVIKVDYVVNSKRNINRMASNALTANKSGYVYVYFSNESVTSVYFDNFMVTHERGSLTEETHYYPFGLVMQGFSSKALAFGNPENKKKYQSYEYNTDFDINLYETFYRSHDPQLGRFWQVDPKPNFSESPYASMGNNPIRNMDPLGDTLLNKSDHKRADRIEKKLNSTNASLNKQATELSGQIADAEAKGDKAKADALRAELGDVNARMNANTTSLSRLDAIRNDQKWGYTFKQLPSGSTEGGTKLEAVKNPKGEQQVAVVMSVLSDANAVHEMTHAYQGMIEKSIILNGAGAVFFGNTLFDRQMSNSVAEIGAYQAQYGFDPTMMPSSTAGGQPQSMNNINAFYVGGIYDNSTPPKPVYPDVRNMVTTILTQMLRF